MSEESAGALGRPKLGIFLFILVAVLLGFLLIAVGILSFRGTVYETIVSTVGATLIGVGVVDVVSEMFIRPGVITLMRRAFPLFSELPKVPKDTLRKLMVNIAGELSPKKEFREEFEDFFEKNIVEQFREYFRENFEVSIKLEKVQYKNVETVKVSAEWTYKVHNITDKKVTYSVPFRSETYSFVGKGIELKDHIKIESMQFTREKKGGNPEDFGSAFGAYNAIPKPQNSVMVLLELEKIPKVEIPPLETLTFFIKYYYLAETCDDHTQRMSMLTKNLTLTIDSDDKEFSLDVDKFCIPETVIAKKGHKYSWNGWFLPSNGVVAFWKMKERPKLQK